MNDIVVNNVPKFLLSQPTAEEHAIGHNIKTIKRILVVTSLEALPQRLARVNKMHHCLANSMDTVVLATSSHGSNDDVFVS